MSLAVRLSTLTVMLMLLGSCAYEYSIRAVIIDGRLAFEVAPWSHRHPDCVRGVDVSVARNGPIAAPDSGDAVGLVQNGGVYWWEQRVVGSCENPFPIFYGQPLKAEPFQYDGGRYDTVKAKPLIIGHVYSVGMQSSGSGYGSGWFRLTSDHRVENWRSEPTPSVLNSQGYDVTVGEHVPPPAKD